jgi:hypothetical protein
MTAGSEEPSPYAGVAVMARYFPTLGVSRELVPFSPFPGYTNDFVVNVYPAVGVGVLPDCFRH